MKHNDIAPHKEGITLTAVFIFLGSIFVLIVGMLFYLRFSSWSPLNGFYIKNIPKGVSFADLFNGEKAKSGELKTIEIKISEEELSKTIGISRSDFPLKSPTLKIKSEGIIISGKTANGFWGVPVDVLFVPISNNGKILFNLKEIKAAGVVAPPKIADTLSPKMNSLFYSNSFSDLDKLKVRDVRTLVGYMIIEIES